MYRIVYNANNPSQAPCPNGYDRLGRGNQNIPSGDISQAHTEIVGFEYPMNYFLDILTVVL